MTDHLNVYLDGIEVPLLYHFGGLASFPDAALPVDATQWLAAQQPRRRGMA